VDVESRCKKDVCTILEDFVTDGLAYRLYKFLVPGRSKKSSDREVSAIVSLVVSLTCRIDTEACRTVSKNDCRDAEALDRVSGTGCARDDVLGHSDYRIIAGIAGHTCTDEKVCLLFNCHSGNHLVKRVLAELRIALRTASRDGGSRQNHHWDFFHNSLSVVLLCVYIFLYIQSAAKITNIHEFVLYMKRYMDALYEKISHHLIETTVTAGREI
jgi:hypothetical protein